MSGTEEGHARRVEDVGEGRGVDDFGLNEKATVEVVLVEYRQTVLD